QKKLSLLGRQLLLEQAGFRVRNLERVGGRAPPPRPGALSWKRCPLPGRWRPGENVAGEFARRPHQPPRQFPVPGALAAPRHSRRDALESLLRTYVLDYLTEQPLGVIALAKESPV